MPVNSAAGLMGSGAAPSPCCGGSPQEETTGNKEGVVGETSTARLAVGWTYFRLLFVFVNNYFRFIFATAMPGSDRSAQ
jgi:hypothetical protein